MINIFKKIVQDYNVDLAERIFEYRTYQPYVKNCPDSQVKKYCWDCKNIQDSLNKVIEVCGEPNSPKARYLYAITYAWSRVEYNDKAIYYLELYLTNELYDKEYKRDPEFHLHEMNTYLGKAYERKYDFDKALEIYNKCLEISPNYQVSYLNIANIYKKKNELNESIKILDKAKSSIYYKGDFKEIIDRYYIDYKEKIKNNYKYKPRKNNQ